MTNVMENLKIILAADHGGFELKEKIKKHLIEKEYRVVDVGIERLESVDYPDFGQKAALEVAKGAADFGILFCGSGIGMSIVANKVKGIRAALCHNTYTARMARAHNNANILALGARVIGDGLAREMVDTFLTAVFEGGRHQRRIDKITQCE